MCHTFKTPVVLLLPFLLMTTDCVVLTVVMTSYLLEAACVSRLTSVTGVCVFRVEAVQQVDGGGRSAAVVLLVVS